MALKSTLEAVKAICNADPSVTAAQVKAAIAELNGEGTKAIQASRSNDGESGCQAIVAQDDPSV